jgi:adenosylhomocysteine nucleosidase
MNDIIVFAMREEAPTLFSKYRNVFCIGVGKVNSAINTTILINQYKPNRVINLGTAGGIKVGPGIYQVREVFQHDVNLKAVGLEAGHHINDMHNFITISDSGYKCASADMFVTEPHKIRLDTDIVEMEAYSVAKSCLLTGTRCEIWKYISDSADENAGMTWQEQVAAGENLYMKVLQDINANLEEK